jgi:hypothetical protein
VLAYVEEEIAFDENAFDTEHVVNEDHAFYDGEDYYEDEGFDDVVVMDDHQTFLDEDEDEPTVVGAEISTAPARGSQRHASSIRRSVDRIKRAYGASPPPGVQELLRMTEAGHFTSLRGALDELWMDLLRHHIKQSSQPPRIVLQSFQSIHSLMK